MLDLLLQRDDEKYIIHREGIQVPKYHSFNYKAFTHKVRVTGRKVYLPWYVQNH